MEFYERVIYERVRIINCYMPKPSGYKIIDQGKGSID